MREVGYDREEAVRYAEKWAFGRNPAYLDFSGLGGDCTNFVSQCVFAGAGVMNYKPTFGWFYRSSSDRTASWTGVEYFYRFITTNAGAGPYAEETGPERMERGDIIQLGNRAGFYHSLVVVYAGPSPSPETIRITAHDYNANRRPLSEYLYEKIRYLHILGVRSPE